MANTASKPQAKPQAPQANGGVPDVASFDFGALGAPKATETWQREGGREAKPVPENILAALRASKANDQAGVWPLLPGAPFANAEDAKAGKPQGLARELQNLLRRGAEQLKLGVRIKIEANEENTGAHVSFLATDRRQYDESKPRKPTRRKDETDVEYNARMAEYERAFSAWQRGH